MARNYSNTAVATTLTSGINSSVTSIPVASVSGYPTPPFTAILEPATASEEVVEVTAVVGTTFTATRGVDGTPAQAHGLGSAVVHGVSARDFAEPNEHPGDTTNVHGIVNTASLVTLTGSQTLTNKTLTSPTVNSGTLNSATLVTPTIASFVNATHTHEDAASGGVVGGGGSSSDTAYKRSGSGSVDVSVSEDLTSGTAVTLGTLVHSVGNTTWSTASANTRIVLPSDIATGYWAVSAGAWVTGITNNAFLQIVHEDLGVMVAQAYYQDTLSGSGFYVFSLATDFTSSAGKWLELRIGSPSGSFSSVDYTRTFLALHRIA